jgi:hypothetical protein
MGQTKIKNSTICHQKGFFFPLNLKSIFAYLFGLFQTNTKTPKGGKSNNNQKLKEKS